MLASHVIKIEYRRTLHQSPIPAESQPLIPSVLAPNKLAISSFLPAFLSGTAQYIETVVTHSKQTLEQFLPGARIACQPHWASSKTMHSASLARPDDGRVAQFLTGSDSHSEMAVTHSKQMSRPFLTGSRIARQLHLPSSEMTQNTGPLVVSFAIGLPEKRCAILARDFWKTIPIM